MELKLCQKCKIEKPLSEFCKRKCEKDGLQRWCAICNRAKGKKWRVANPEKARIHSGKWRKNHPEVELRIKRVKRIAYRSRWMVIIKERGMNYCSVCGYDKCFSAIHFHHIKAKEKNSERSYSFQHPPTEERIKGLYKCIALCANCHIELHENLRRQGNGKAVRETDVHNGGEILKHHSPCQF